MNVIENGRSVKAKNAPTGVAAWIDPDTLRISANTTKGVVTKVYTVVDCMEEGEVLGWRLEADGGETYWIGIVEGEINCNCKDAQYRQRECKHVKALLAGLEKRPKWCDWCGRTGRVLLGREGQPSRWYSCDECGGTGKVKHEHFQR